MPAPYAPACTSCRLWRAVASGATSTTNDGMREGGLAQLPPRSTLSASGGHRSSNVAPAYTDDLDALLTLRAFDDPAWWLVVRQYALGLARWPDPFQPRKPKRPLP